MVEGTEVSERENIFARIREALQVPAPRLGQGGHGAPGNPVPGLPSPADYRRVMPPSAETMEEQLALFQKNAADLRADFRLLDSATQFAAELKKLGAAENWKSVATHKGALTDEATRGLGLTIVRADAAFDHQTLGRCEAGISECDALVAQTGSVLLTSRTSGGRALSVLPPHHVVLARCAQLVADLPAAFTFLKAKYAKGYPSMISLITGPSRTGDIERILVLGAHGPKKLTVFCSRD